MVEISRTVGGPVVDSYPVRDKAQEAEIDPGMIVDDELFSVEAWEPCLVCGTTDEGHGAMYCDGCDRTVHIFCAGFDDAPDVWYCETCMLDLETETSLPGMAAATRRRRPRRAGPARPRTQRNPRRGQPNDYTWARVWQEVSRRLDMDLDFPFDEDTAAIDERTEEQRREFRRWQRRFEVASNQSGATHRLRNIAQGRLLPEALPPAPESQEELRAWNAFDKARESNEAPLTVRRRKRRATASPASNNDGEETEQPQLKKPRLRRPPTGPGQPESSNAAAARKEPTFLSSLLREVEGRPSSAASPATSEQVQAGQYSPRNSSPARSPSSSDCGSPHGTPPPQRPLSPPLSSTVLPFPSPIAATFSPFSPAETREDYEPDGLLSRGRRRRPVQHHSDGVDRASSASPSRGLSYSAKEELQRMVKLALGTRYRDKEITKDQYTDINKNVSRKLYELVQDASALSGKEQRERWQSVADEEVRKAVSAITPSSSDD